MIKLATGVARITRIIGESSALHTRLKDVAAASSAPASAPAANPASTRSTLIPAVCQNDGSPAARHRARAVAAGPGSSSSIPMAEEASCHTSSQKARTPSD